MRLIDADALKDMKFSGGMHDDNWIMYVPFREVVENIDKAPTVGGWTRATKSLKKTTESLVKTLTDRILVEGPCSLSTLLRAAADHLKKLQEVIDNASVSSGYPD